MRGTCSEYNHMPDIFIFFPGPFSVKLECVSSSSVLFYLEDNVHVGFPGKWALRWKVACKKFIRVNEKSTTVEGKERIQEEAGGKARLQKKALVDPTGSSKAREALHNEPLYSKSSRISALSTHGIQATPESRPRFG